MEQDRRPRKKTDGAEQSARRAGTPKVVAFGKLKGRPVAGPPRPDSRKSPVAATRRGSEQSEKIVKGRQALPVQRERSSSVDDGAERSLRLRLLVEGGRITLLDAREVAAPGTLPDQLRGTSFIEVRVGGQVVAADALIDPGLAIGTPDPRDKEFRGHRFVELPSYETVIRVPLALLQAGIERTSQGIAENRRRRDAPKLEINIYEAETHLVIDPRRAASLVSAQRGKLNRTAQSGELDLEQVRGAGGRDQKPRDTTR